MESTLLEDMADVSDSPITFADLGIPVEEKIQQTIIGKTRTCSSITKWEWIYLTTSLISLTISLGLTIHKIATLDPSSFDFTFALVLLYTSLFCYYYVIHGVLKERAYELLVFVTTIAVVMAYSIINYVSKATVDLKLVRLILVAILGPILIIAGICLSRQYYESGNLIYRTVGGNLELQSMCRMMFLFSSLLKFDLQLQGSMFILVMENGTSIQRDETILLVLGIFVTVVFIVTGFLSIRTENRIIAISFLAMSVYEPAYIIYKFYVAQNQTGILHVSTYVCGVLSLLVWIGLIVCMWFVMQNFGKGLKEKVYGDPTKLEESKAETSESSKEAVQNQEQPETITQIS